MFVGSAWQNDTKSLFYDSNSKRGGVLLHAKVRRPMDELTLGVDCNLRGQAKYPRRHQTLS